jgi:hypothetical protein
MDQKPLELMIPGPIQPDRAVLEAIEEVLDGLASFKR